MLQKLPGSVLEAELTGAEAADALLTPMFMTGGLVLSQVSLISGLEPYVIQNWVKRGFLSPPVKKKYSRRQLSRILIINMLRSSMQMEKICSLLSYINGTLNDESDDSIDDSQLYLYLVGLAASAEAAGKTGVERMDAELDRTLESYAEPFPGAKKRVKHALRVMLVAYEAARLQQIANDMLGDIDL